ITEVKCRYDVVSIVARTGQEPVIELIRGFWSEAKFRKKAWSGESWQNT
ncbi:MAG: hypothetical protein HOP17_12635, partial [Acidobacteria bacterium]|nr:hypothetical protein [Acidobacteriota bacterium]